MNWFRKRRSKETELNEELQFHLEEEADLQREEGKSAEDAQRAARRDLGNVTQVRENTRAAWGWTALSQFGQDLRYAVRTLNGARSFALLAILSLALGIGANTALFSFMDAILLRSLPVSDPDSLVVLNWHGKRSSWRDSVIKGMSGRIDKDDNGEFRGGIFPYPAFELFQKTESGLSSIFAHFQTGQLERLNVGVRGQTDIAKGWSVSGEYFQGLGVLPAAGRMLVPDDNRAGAPSVAVVSYGYSERRFGGPANAVGQEILIDNLPFTIVGVTPKEFFGVDPSEAPDAYVPLHANEVLGKGRNGGFSPESYLAKNEYWIQIMGRLRPGVNRAHVQAVLAPAFRHWVEATAANDREKATLPALVVEEGAAGLESLRRQYSKALYVLMTLVSLILVLACANIANLLLARASARRREIALRLSLGASRLRIVRQLLTESVLLGVLGGGVGILFAMWGIRALTALLANGQANFTLHASLNWHVLLAAAGLSLLTSVLFGLAPALQATRVDVMPALKATRSSGSEAGSRFGLRQALIAGQISIALLMLVAAGLFVRTLSNLRSIDLGFNRQNLLLFQLDARKAGHNDPEISRFYRDLQHRFSAIPGVHSISLAQGTLIRGESARPIAVAGSQPDNATRYLMVGPEFFATMQIPILAGRDIREDDHTGSLGVAVINEVFAKANFGHENPLGRRLVLFGPGDKTVARNMEIVGVARNSHYGNLKKGTPSPVVYMPYDQGFPEPNEMVYELRTAGDPLRYVSSVREIVARADSRIPVSEIRTQTGEIDRETNQEIMFARLCTGFAVLALVIACVGLYSTVSYNVARRTSEIGIRMALGAQPGRVVWTIVRGILGLTAAGLAIGMIAALAMSRFVASFLYGVKPNDGSTLALAVIALILAAPLAAWLPSRRASRIDPMTALRHE